MPNECIYIYIYIYEISIDTIRGQTLLGEFYIIDVLQSKYYANIHMHKIHQASKM